MLCERPLTHAVAIRPVHFYDVRSDVGEQHSAEWAHREAEELDDPNAFERSHGLYLQSRRLSAELVTHPQRVEFQEGSEY
jgi:hypothetical protein